MSLRIGDVAPDFQLRAKPRSAKPADLQRSEDVIIVPSVPGGRSEKDVSAGLEDAASLSAHVPMPAA
jgi:hypothetical protein